MHEFEQITRKKREQPMRWIPTLPAFQGTDPDLREFMGAVEEDIRGMVGTYYYFISCGAGGPALCRVDLYTRGKYPREVLDHVQFGITDDDLHHAVGLAEGNAPAPGYHTISDHIEGKLRALLEA